ncbi:phosphotransferase [Phenylobacterium sp.]|uniref:phosphotransferase n=1 Tax=Phenylobacterium sp. TaxID=1871053 RepID=UPI00286A9063|nr:phosphotransferase [Phenylobacterium sp.]
MSGGPPDIRRPEAIDAEWLTRALRHAGIDAEVAGFTARAVGTGQIGDSVRFALTYARGGDAAPASLVGKFPSADPASFGTGVMLGNYEREVMFYRHLADGALIRTPRCLFADIAPGSGEFVLLMEDLAPAEAGDQLKGVSLDQAGLVIDEAAKLHASHWTDPSLDDLPWVSGSAAAPVSQVNPEMVRQLWGGFRARYEERLQPDWIEVGERVSQRYGVLSAARDGPRCLTHNDFRPDNMMFATAAGGRPVTVLDWQSFAYGVGATDVAYFLAGALSPALRREHEAALLDRYLAGLRAHGVADYSRDELARDYGQGGFLLFMTAFFAAMVVKQTPRGDEMFLQMLGAASRHIIDHDALLSLS